MSSMTCIMCFTWLVSHLLISSSRASSRSGPLHICVKRQRGETLAQDEEKDLHLLLPLKCLHININVSQPNSY
uniref:Secreted protein n=1 Tax=Pundamilia nyererei TaxID=303518 RepID=A0A3B4FP91_9CICH